MSGNILMTVIERETRRAEHPPPANESPAAVGAATGPNRKKKSARRTTNTRTSGPSQEYSRAWPLVITDGRETIGYVWSERGRFAATTVERAPLGIFRCLQEASQAVFAVGRDGRPES